MVTPSFSPVEINSQFMKCFNKVVIENEEVFLHLVVKKGVVDLTQQGKALLVCFFWIHCIASYCSSLFAGNVEHGNSKRAVSPL